MAILAVSPAAYGEGGSGGSAGSGAEADDEGGSGALSAGSGKLIRLMSVHPRRRTSASYARAASPLE